VVRNASSTCRYRSVITTVIRVIVFFSTNKKCNSITRISDYPKTLWSVINLDNQRYSLVGDPCSLLCSQLVSHSALLASLKLTVLHSRYQKWSVMRLATVSSSSSKRRRIKGFIQGGSYTFFIPSEHEHRWSCLYPLFHILKLSCVPCLGDKHAVFR
jgi:hypothetical protein